MKAFAGAVTLAVLAGIGAASPVVASPPAAALGQQILADLRQDMSRHEVDALVDGLPLESIELPGQEDGLAEVVYVISQGKGYAPAVLRLSYENDRLARALYQSTDHFEAEMRSFRALEARND